MGEPLIVTCAIIERDDTVLAARRGAAMQTPGCWEFPGGKLRPSESPELGIAREIIEELAIEVRPLMSLPPSTYSYPEITVTLLPFVCAFISGDIRMAEHDEVRWCGLRELEGLRWCEADIPVLRAYLRTRQKG